MGESPRGRQESGRRPRAEKGGEHSHRNDDRRRHAARGAETSSGGWQVASAGDVQVGGALRWERRWGAGENERGL